MHTPNDIIVNIAKYLDYSNKIIMAKTSREIYRDVYPKLRYIIFWEDRSSPSEYSTNIYLCKSRKDAVQKYKIAKQNIENYGHDGIIDIDIVIEGEIRKYYYDKKLTNLCQIIKST